MECDLFQQLDFDEHLALLLTNDNVPIIEDENTSFSEHALPPWIDKEKFKNGQVFYSNNLFALFVSKLAGLTSTLAIPTMLRILIFTKQSSTIEKAYRRYVLTIWHMHLWYTKDIDHSSDFWKSLAEVCWKHKRANLNAKKTVGTITQRDMALTQFGFIGYALTRSKILGLHFRSAEDLDGFIHFWKVIGWILGIKDNYNLCRNSTNETIRLCEELIHQLFKPAILTTDAHYKEMTHVLLQASVLIYPFIPVNNFKGFVRFLTEFRVSNSSFIEEMKELEELGLFNKLQLFKGQFFIRSFFNFQIRIMLFLIRYFPVLAMYKFGLKKSYVKIFNN